MDGSSIIFVTNCFLALFLLSSGCLAWCENGQSAETNKSFFDGHSIVGFPTKSMAAILGRRCHVNLLLKAFPVWNKASDL